MIAWILFQIRRGITALEQFFYNIGLAIAKGWYYILSAGAYVLAVCSVPLDNLRFLLKKKDDPHLRSQNTSQLKQKRHPASQLSNNSHSYKPKDLLGNNRTNTAPVFSIGRAPVQPVNNAAFDSALRKIVQRVADHAQFSRRLQEGQVFDDQGLMTSYRAPFQDKPKNLNDWIRLFLESPGFMHAVRVQMQKENHPDFNISSKEHKLKVQKILTDLDSQRILRYDHIDYFPKEKEKLYKEALETQIRTVINHAQFSSRLESSTIYEDQTRNTLSYRGAFLEKPKNIEGWKSLFRKSSGFILTIQFKMREEMTSFDFNVDSTECLQALDDIIDDLNSQGALKYDYPDYFPIDKQQDYQECFKTALKQVMEVLKFSQQNNLCEIASVSEGGRWQESLASLETTFDMPRDLEAWTDFLFNKEAYFYINKALCFYMKASRFTHGMLFTHDYSDWTEDDTVIIREVIAELDHDNKLRLASAQSASLNRK